MSDKVEYSNAKRVTNPGGSQVWKFEQPQKIYSFIRPPSEASINDYEISAAGQKVEVEYLMDVLESGQRSNDAVPDEKITDVEIQINDHIATPEGNYKVVSKIYHQNDNVDSFALAQDKRGGPDYGSSPGDGGPDTPGNGIPIALPESFERGNLDAYEGSDKLNQDGQVIKSPKTIHGDYYLGCPIKGETIYDGDSPNLTSKGNYYSLTYNYTPVSFDRPYDITRFYFGMGVSSVDAQSYILEIPNNGNLSLLYRDRMGSETYITDNASGQLNAPDVRHAIVIRWDDGTLGGKDGDIEVAAYDMYKDKKVASVTANSTAISSGTIGWGSKAPGGAGYVDYLRNEQYTPIDRKGSVLESFESGNLNNYSTFTNNFTVKKEYRVTDGDYLLEMGGDFSFLYNTNASSGTSKGHFYTFNAYSMDTDNSTSHQTYRFYFAMGGAPTTDEDHFEVNASADGSVDILYEDDSGNRSNIEDTKITNVGGSNEHVTVQIWWDDASLGGNDGDIGVEVFRKFNGERILYAEGNTSGLSSLPTSGTYGWASNAGQESSTEPVLIDNLREATKPTFTSKDTPPGK